jgi:cytochrome bd ubiquinol oxidase subunit I
VLYGPLIHGLLAAGFEQVDQHYLLQARQMQAISLAVHIPLVCFGIALPALVIFVEWLGIRTRDPVYTTLARRWSRIMISLFAVGVVTGTILSFELGLLWPVWMARFGDVFGFAFALEGVSFFMEAIFIGIYVYGWDRFSPRVHLLTGIPIAISGMTGSLTVIAVNGWMNHPGGFTIQDGQVTNVHPFAALFENSYFWHELVHMYLAGYIVVGFVLAGVYAWGRLRGRWGRYERAALAIPLTVAALAAPAQIVIGDWNGRAVAEDQPVKLAAFEGLARTTKGAPEHILGWYDGTGVEYGIKIPDLLSLLAYHDPHATVQGLDTVPPSDRPPVNWVRFSFQTMVFIGTGLAFLGMWYVFVRIFRRRLPRSVWFYRALVTAAPASIVALLAGWITTEVGRQPWIVYNVMRTSEAVTGADGLPVGLATVVAVYVLLAGLVVWLLRRLARKPLELQPPADSVSADVPG